MTVLNYSEALNCPRQEIWRCATTFSQELPRHLPWIEKVEHLGGNPNGAGGRWSFHVIASAGLWPLDLEITEWMEGERIVLMPMGISGIFKDIQLFQIIVELKEKNNGQTQILVFVEYEPVGKLGRLNNLLFWRRRFGRVIVQAVDVLSRVIMTELWLHGVADKKNSALSYIAPIIRVTVLSKMHGAILVRLKSPLQVWKRKNVHGCIVDVFSDRGTDR
jgi:hypothetical protein